VNVLQLTTELVGAPSTNPPGSTVEVAHVVSRFAAAAGLPVTLVDGGDGRHNLIVGGTPDGKPRLIFNGHLDVVPIGDPAAWTSPPHEPEVRDGLLHGRGTADTKGGVAAALVALADVHRTQPEATAQIELHLVADEEIFGDGGTKALLLGHAQRLREVELAVVIEPTDLACCTAERSSGYVRLTVHGEPAHAGEYRCSPTPIEAMCRFVDQLLANTPVTRNGLQTMVGTIRGGTASNVQPAECTAEVDLRWPASLDGQLVDIEIRDLIARFTTDVAPLTVTVDAFSIETGFEGHAPGPLLEAAFANAQLPLHAEVFPAASDGRLLAALVQQVVVCGPGRFSAAHTIDECVSTAQLQRAAELYAAIMREVAAPRTFS
jgi:acetylornithine deacetylase/succinyl-diaminopimelate desuccinylase-like protein